jgi:hypothetical protein
MVVCFSLNPSSTIKPFNHVVDFAPSISDMYFSLVEESEIVCWCLFDDVTNPKLI